MQLLNNEFPDITMSTDFVYDICYASRSKKKPVPVSQTSSNAIFDIIHADI